MSNKIRSRDRIPFDFQDGVQVKGIDITDYFSGINTGDQTFITGNAGTATTLETARTIAGVPFDGSTNIELFYNALTGLPPLGTVAAKDVAADGNASVTQIVAGNDTRLNGSQVLRTNSSAMMMYFGQPVHSVTEVDINLAQADDVIRKNVMGLVSVSSIVNNMSSGLIQTNGVLKGTTAQWDSVTGQTDGLTLGKQYFLSNILGKLTHTPVMSSGYFLCSIGKAISSTELLINIEQSITL